MSINRFPIVIWGTLSANAAGLLAVPTVSIACLMLWMDRHFGTHFFNARNGGQPLLWQHLFWIRASVGIHDRIAGNGNRIGRIAGLLPASARRLYRRGPFDLVTMLIGFGVWVHHMFATGLPVLGLSFFAATSILISLPSGVQVCQGLRPRRAVRALALARPAVLPSAI
jgi:hypothetical protein